MVMNSTIFKKIIDYKERSKDSCFREGMEGFVDPLTNLLSVFVC